MRADAPASMSIRQLDCPARMFVASVCLTDDDLERFGFLSIEAPLRVSRDTAARSAVHRLCRTDEALSRAIDDLLDLRHLDVVSEVRVSTPERLAARAAFRGMTSTGEELAGWAWALLSDPREAVASLGKRLMGECYVRGMRSLAEPGSLAVRSETPGIRKP